MGHARINKGRMKGDDPEIDTAQTPKRFNGNLALLEKIRKTFADSIPNNDSENLFTSCLFSIERVATCGASYFPIFRLCQNFRLFLVKEQLLIQIFCVKNPSKTMCLKIKHNLYCLRFDA